MRTSLRLAGVALTLVALAGCQSDEPDQVKGDSTPLAGSSQFPPDESKTVYRSSNPYWKVIVAVTRTENDPRLEEAEQSLTEAG